MTEIDILNQTNGAYLSLIHPARGGEAYRQQIAPIVALAPSVSDELIATMITGTSWRERLLGLCIAMARRPAVFTELMLESLRDPRSIVIVPTCAALAVLAQRGSFSMPESFSEMFERTAFDSEVGWATDKAMFIAGLRSNDVPGRGPNYGQIFEDHVEVYNWLHEVGRQPD